MQLELQLLPDSMLLGIGDAITVQMVLGGDTLLNGGDGGRIEGEGLLAIGLCRRQRQRLAAEQRRRRCHLVVLSRRPSTPLLVLIDDACRLRLDNSLYHVCASSQQNSVLPKNYLLFR